jgi:hypothetical protein
MFSVTTNIFQIKDMTFVGTSYETGQRRRQNKDNIMKLMTAKNIYIQYIKSVDSVVKLKLRTIIYL